ncbi:MAG: PspC domain-containing protein [Eggerthella lenta]
MTSEKRLLRSRKALIGGVCAGVADYFNVDPVIVRIIMVVFTLASGGLLGIAYILLWIVLPLEPKEEAPLDVHPQSVHSETYGTFEFGGTPRKTESGAQNAPIRASAGWRYAHPRTPRPLMCRPSPGRRIARLCRCACRCSRSYAPPAGHSHEGWMHAAPQQQPPAKSSRSA